MTDFKFKIDLENQSIIPETPKKESKKKKKDPSKTGGEKSRKKKPAEHNTEPRSEPTAKKKKKKKEVPQNVETEKKKINSNSIISLTLLPNNESANKLDQVQKLSLITKKKPRHWEKRWVLMQNVYEFTKEIWIKKWVLVDGGEDISDNNVLSLLLRITCKPTTRTVKHTKKVYLKSTNAHLMNVGRYLRTQALLESIFLLTEKDM